MCKCQQSGEHKRRRVCLASSSLLVSDHSTPVIGDYHGYGVVHSLKTKAGVIGEWHVPSGGTRWGLTVLMCQERIKSKSSS